MARPDTPLEEKMFLFGIECLKIPKNQAYLQTNPKNKMIFGVIPPVKI